MLKQQVFRPPTALRCWDLEPFEAANRDGRALGWCPRPPCLLSPLWALEPAIEIVSWSLELEDMHERKVNIVYCVEHYYSINTLQEVEYDIDHVT